MATEKRLIYLDDTLEATHKEVFWTESEAAAVRSFLVKQPKVDAVEVVRCKDCTFWTYEGVGSSTLKRFGRCAKWYPFGNEQHNCHDDDFCSYGERKDNG